MKSSLIAFTALILLLLGSFSACTKKDISIEKETIEQEPTALLVFNYNTESIQSVLDLPETPFDYTTYILPDIFIPTVSSFNTPSDNPITDQGATLGRVLFYDQSLSRNNTVSCGTCHRQEFGFADNIQFSRGVDHKETRRNTPHLVNMSYLPEFFWDTRVGSLEEQVLGPIEDHIELGMESLDVLVSKLASKSYYPDLFYAAFGDEQITEERISKALAQFVRSIRSYSTKFDEAVQLNGGDYYGDLPLFSAKENEGLELFRNSRCNSCHIIPTMENSLNPWNEEQLPKNIGLYKDYPDNGLGELTNDPLDDGKFKIPSLRNVALTAPYMHDGSLKTLEQVIDHYRTGIKDHPNLSGVLINSVKDKPIKIEIKADEVKALIVFLKTLTDEELVKDEKYSNPFRNTKPN